MNIQFSEEEKLWISRQGLLQDTERSFSRTLKSILHEVGQRFQSTGWKANLSDRCLQIYRHHWQEDWEGIHYETYLNTERLLDGQLHVGLHVEKNTPAYRAVAPCLAGYLQPHEERLLKKYKSVSHGFHVPSTALHAPERDQVHVLEGSIGLVRLTSDRLYDALERLTHTASFVEEALFVGDGVNLWRTDFCTDRPRPNLEWGKERASGGQSYRMEGGRLAGPSLHINGTCGGNYDLTKKKQPDDYDPSNKGPVNIMRLVDAGDCEIQNGDQLYLSCVVNTQVGGRLWFDGHGHPAQGSALLDVPCKPNWIPIDVPGKPIWQHLGIPLAPVCKHRNYDFAKQGAKIFLISQTKDPEFSISSIEIGRRPKRGA